MTQFLHLPILIIDTTQIPKFIVTCIYTCGLYKMDRCNFPISENFGIMPICSRSNITFVFCVKQKVRFTHFLLKVALTTPAQAKYGFT